MLSGSSPRVRGKRDEGVLDGDDDGLIPARAGKTCAPSPRPPDARAHPRACGENTVTVSTGSAWRGSSPRVRGKLPRALRGVRGRRLIPARAGKTSAPPTPPSGGAAHPRACGENTVASLSLTGNAGSSPRVRGKLCIRYKNTFVFGLIPARAGKTSRLWPRTGCSWAHPRACGENAQGTGPVTSWRGSSPRVRGKRGLDLHEGARVGLIPARAGKTGPRSVSTPSICPHPRACGENRSRRRWRPSPWGSSPRVRGKQPPRGRPQGGGRLIPARAGKTARRTRNRRRRPAHPRACGEND